MFWALLALVGAACGGGDAGDAGSDPGGGGGSPQPGFLVVAPAEDFSSAGPQGGPFSPSSKTYTLRNTGESTLEWAAVTPAPGVELSSSGGLLDGGAETVVLASLDPVLMAPLPGGDYHSHIEFLNLTSGAGDTAVGVALEVLQPGVLAVTPGTDLVAVGPAGGPFEPTGISYTLANSGAQSLAWSVDSDADWVSATPSAGELAGGGQIAVQVEIVGALAAGLGAGEHLATLGFGDPGQDAPVTQRLVRLSVGFGAGLLEVPETQAFEPGGPTGGPFTDSASYTVRNSGTASLDWSATSSAPWLELWPAAGSLAPGAQAVVTASVAAPVAAAYADGSYPAELAFHDLSSATLGALVPATLWVGTAIEQGSWLRLEGQKFIPIGVWNQPPWEGSVLALKGLGINTYLNNGLGPPEPTNPQLLDLLQANGMVAWLKFDPAVINHPALLGWLLGDEPDIKDISPAQVQAEYDAVLAADPKHLIALNLTAGFFYDQVYGDPSKEPLYQQYAAVPDLVSFDHYPVTGWNKPEWVYRPGAASAFLRSHYLNHQRPVMAIVEASDQNLSWTPPGTPGPSAAQLRFEAWDCIIHGATSIAYFTIAFNPFQWSDLTPQVEAEMAHTNGQIRALTEIICSAAPPLVMTTAEAGGQAHNALLRKSGEVYWIFADNADMGYGSETLTFSFAQPVRSVSVYDEGRTIAPSGNSFSDAFAPLEVHIYRVEF